MTNGDVVYSLRFFKSSKCRDRAGIRTPGGGAERDRNGQRLGGRGTEVEGQTESEVGAERDRGGGGVEAEGGQWRQRGVLLFFSVILFHTLDKT